MPFVVSLVSWARGGVIVQLQDSFSGWAWWEGDLKQVECVCGAQQPVRWETVQPDTPGLRATC